MHSIVEYHSDHSAYKCGYCRRPNTNYSRGMWAHVLSVSDYQELIDRGWRRSGLYCYKPTMDVTCCQAYTIRCRALEFKASKSQKKILKRFNKSLMGQEEHVAGDAGRRMSTGSSNLDELHGEERDHFVESNKEHQKIDVNSVIKSQIEDDLPTKNGENSSSHLKSAETCATNLTNDSSVTTLIQAKEVIKDVGPDPNKPPCMKAKQLRLQRKLQKLKEKGVDVMNLPKICKNKEKQLEDFINELPDELKKKLEIRLVRTAPPSPEFLATFKETHAVYVKYQTIIHNDKPDKVTEPKFKQFLVDSPLSEEHSVSGPPCGYGSFHQQYWMDGKIIAIGVIDILPKCVSSVYFFYDPDYMNLTLGTLGALREIQFTRELQKSASDIKYYYMGYYIHSCIKMKYKGKFFPSDLLCPETYNWFPLQECIPKLDISPYSRLDPDIDHIDENCPNEEDLNFVPVLKSSTVMFYEVYKRKFKIRKGDMDVMEYAQLVGRKCALSIILCR